MTAEMAAEPMCRGTLGSLHACGFHIKNKVLKEFIALYSCLTTSLCYISPPKCIKNKGLKLR